MDSFLRVYAIYRSITRWKVVVWIYQESRLSLRVIMWTAKILFISLAVLGLLASSWHMYFASIVVVAAIWALSFSKARTEVLSELRRLYPERIKFFSKDYQYIRYLSFKERLISENLPGNLDDTLAFVGSHVEAGINPPITSHPFMLFTSGAILAILGGAAGQWPGKYIAAALLVLAMLFYFSYMVIDITRSPMSDLREFKRFLLWARDESLKPTPAVYRTLRDKAAQRR